MWLVMSEQGNVYSSGVILEHVKCSQLTGKQYSCMWGEVQRDEFMKAVKKD